MADENETPIEETDDVEPDAVDEAEEADEEYRQSRRLDGPGVEGYNPKSDPLLVNTVLQEAVAHELTLSEGLSSPTWDALYAEWEKANPETDS